MLEEPSRASDIGALATKLMQRLCGICGEFFELMPGRALVHSLKVAGLI